MLNRTLSVRPCWFCGSDENPPGATTCGFCHHHVDDGPAAGRPEPEVGK